MSTATRPDDVASLGAALQTMGRPHVESWLELDVVAGIGRGDLDVAVFRHYLEQDYVYLRNYARLFARLAGIAPDEHVEHLVGLAHGVVDVELDHHRAVGARFGCDFERVTPSAVCLEYMAFLHDATADFGAGLVAMMPCIWGYGLVAALLPLPPEGPYRSWVETYDGDRYQALVDRHVAMLDDSGIDHETAAPLFLRGLELEVAFWDQPLPDPSP